MEIGTTFVVVYREVDGPKPWAWTLVTIDVTDDGRPVLIPCLPGGYFQFRFQAMSEARRQAERRGGMSVLLMARPWTGPIRFGLTAIAEKPPPPPERGRAVMRHVLLGALILTACGGNGASEAFTEESLCEGREPLAFEELSVAQDDGRVTLDLLCFPDTPWRQYLDAVTDLAFEADIVEPLGTTDRNVIQYGLASCEDEATPVPAEWEPAPGGTQADVDRFAGLARRQAEVFLCRLL